jgi:hypothetical protein
MNIEQLEMGQRLQKELKDLNQTQKELIENYKKYTDSTDICIRESCGLSISFQPCENHKVVSINSTPELRKAVFETINNYIMREITNKEAEFMGL